ncbi:MAG: hypothetical protein Mars2KO_25320 [Maribacter sp.]|uniref:YegP family protein n=1 Tax=Maribacter sp. 2307UL18-2 TaxID=3386274 RepID=UPI0039BCC8D3
MIEVIKEKDDDSFRFSLKAESGSVLLTSALFQNEGEVSRIVQSLGILQGKRNAFERKTNHDGQFLFHLKNVNGEVIGTSQSYRSEAGMENGIKNLKKRILDLASSDQLQLP